MRKTAVVLLTIFAIVPSISNADPSTSNEVAKNKVHEEKQAASTVAIDTVNFCYFADKAYSEGAVLNDMMCERHHEDFVKADKKETLYWSKVSSRIIRK